MSSDSQKAGTAGRNTHPNRYPVSLGAGRAVIDVLFSSDLAHWREGVPQPEAVSMDQLGDGRALVTWRVLPPFRDEPQVFMRLRAVGQ